jgi:hypothetical protein
MAGVAAMQPHAALGAALAESPTEPAERAPLAFFHERDSSRCFNCGHLQRALIT